MPAINIGSIEADLEVNSGHMERGLANGRQAIAAIQGELTRLGADFRAGAIATNDYAARTVELEAAISSLSAKMQGAYAASTKTGAALNSVGQNARGAGNNILQLGYATQDLAQGGFGAILNNIPGIVMGLGLGPGVAGVLGAVGVAAFIAGPFLKSLSKDLFGVGLGADDAMTKLELLERRLKELKDNPARLVVDDQELQKVITTIDDIKKAIQLVKTLQTGQTSQEQASGKRVQSQIDEAAGGSPAVLNDLREQATREAFAYSKQFQDAKQKLEKAREDAEAAKNAFRKNQNIYTSEGVSMTRNNLKNAQGVYDKARNNVLAPEGELDQLVGDTVRRATKGSGDEQRIGREKLVGWLGRAGRSTLAERIESSSPQDIADDAQFEEETKKRKEQADKNAAQRAKNEAAQKVNEKEFRTQNLDLARQIDPGFDKQARDLQAQIDAKKISREAARKQLAESLTKEKELTLGGTVQALMTGKGPAPGAGMTSEDAAQAARDALDQQAAIDPAERAKQREQEAKAAKAKSAAAKAAEAKQLAANIQEAEAAVPGLRQQVAMGVGQMAIGNLSPQQLTKALKEKLIDEGYDEKDAIKMSGVMIRTNYNKLAQQVAGDQLQPPHAVRNAVEDFAGLSRGIQAGVGEDVGKSSLNVQKQMVDYLAQILRQGQNVVGIEVN